MHIITPDLIIQAVIETIVAMPVRRIKRIMIIPGIGNNSRSKRGGIQSCIVAALLSVCNIKTDGLDGNSKGF